MRPAKRAAPAPSLRPERLSPWGPIYSGISNKRDRCRDVWNRRAYRSDFLRRERLGRLDQGFHFDCLFRRPQRLSYHRKEKYERLRRLGDDFYLALYWHSD